MSYNVFKLPNNANCHYFSGGRFMTLDQVKYGRLCELCAAITANNHVNFIYRADDRLEQTYEVADKNSPTLADIVFMVGEKGNEFINIDYNNRITQNHIEQLFNRIHDVVINSLNNGIAVRKRIPGFNFKNDKFYHFFADTQNYHKFFQSFLSKYNWIVNDYYEMFLHGVRKNSPGNISSKMLSTTLDRNVAKQFATGRGIFYVGWVHDSGYIQFSDMNKRNKQIAKLGLPTYTAVFPEQKEICLKFGLPPHNIIGYFCDNEHFIVNHHFLLNRKNDETTINNLLKHGFYIDQSNFLQYLGKTKYVRGYDVVNNRYIH